MSGRKTSVDPAYRVSIPGVLLPRTSSSDTDTWHPFLMQTDDMLELYQAIKHALNLT